MTALHPAWAYVVLVAASALLLQAAWTDLREFKIRNELVLALAGLFVIYALIAPQWLSLKWDLAFAAIMFLALLVFYALGGMGGGDVKILAVAFLWTGLSGALPFSIFLAIFSGAHAIAAKLGWARSQVAESGRRRIPFAPSVAGALICTLVLRAMRLA